MLPLWKGGASSGVSARDVASESLQCTRTRLQSNRAVTSCKTSKTADLPARRPRSFGMKESCFPEPLEAWTDGPMCPDLYQLHRRRLHLQGRGYARGPRWAGRNLDRNNPCRSRLLAATGCGRYLSDLSGHWRGPWIKEPQPVTIRFNGLPSQADDLSTRNQGRILMEPLNMVLGSGKDQAQKSQYKSNTFGLGKAAISAPSSSTGVFTP